MTGSMQRAIQETERRRAKQHAHNVEHHITPRSVLKAVRDIMEGAYSDRSVRGRLFPKNKTNAKKPDFSTLSPQALSARIAKVETEMYEHAHNLEFEEAAKLRDLIQEMRDSMIGK
jgi:excinuclease ABC subunit B